MSKRHVLSLIEREGVDALRQRADRADSRAEWWKREGVASNERFDRQTAAMLRGRYLDLRCA